MSSLFVYTLWYIADIQSRAFVAAAMSFSAPETQLLPGSPFTGHLSPSRPHSTDILHYNLSRSASLMAFTASAHPSFPTSTPPNLMTFCL